MKQLDWRKISETQAAMNLKNSRRTNKDYFNQHKILHYKDHKLWVGDLVLLINNELLPSRNRQKKINNRWHSPYRIWEVAEDSTFYRLEELDETPLTSSIARNRLKKFFVTGEDEEQGSEGSTSIPETNKAGSVDEFDNIYWLIVSIQDWQLAEPSWEIWLGQFCSIQNHAANNVFDTFCTLH